MINPQTQAFLLAQQGNPQAVQQLQQALLAQQQQAQQAVQQPVQQAQQQPVQQAAPAANGAIGQAEALGARLDGDLRQGESRSAMASYTTDRMLNEPQVQRSLEFFDNTLQPFNRQYLDSFQAQQDFVNRRNAEAEQERQALLNDPNNPLLQAYRQRFVHTGAVSDAQQAGRMQDLPVDLPPPTFDPSRALRPELVNPQYAQQQVQASASRSRPPGSGGANRKKQKWSVYSTRLANGAQKDIGSSFSYKDTGNYQLAAAGKGSELNGNVEHLHQQWFGEGQDGAGEYTIATQKRSYDVAFNTPVEAMYAQMAEQIARHGAVMEDGSLRMNGLVLWPEDHPNANKITLDPAIANEADTDKRVAMMNITEGKVQQMLKSSGFLGKNRQKTMQRMRPTDMENVAYSPQSQAHAFERGMPHVLNLVFQGGVNETTLGMDYANLVPIVQQLKQQYGR